MARPIHEGNFAAEYGVGPQRLNDPGRPRATEQTQMRDRAARRQDGPPRSHDWRSRGPRQRERERRGVDPQTRHWSRERSRVANWRGQPNRDNHNEVLEARTKLPALEVESRFLEMIKKNQAVIIHGDTGSGKTTQLPQFLLDGRIPYLHGEEPRCIVCTQPRRVAAINVAERVAKERGVELGKEVGYLIRFEDKTSRETMLRFSTEGMFLQEFKPNEHLNQYSVVILDEVHERTMNMALLCGLLKEVMTRNRRLKVVVMSATMDTTKMSAYFGNAPVLRIPGRSHPVQIFYAVEPQHDHVEAAIQTVLQIHTEESAGDILVFLTGQDEIDEVCRRLQDVAKRFTKYSKICALPLYSGLPKMQQQQVFEKVEGQKVVVATNIAETSITIDGIVYVIDAGYIKQKFYNPRNRVETLAVSTSPRPRPNSGPGGLAAQGQGSVFACTPRMRSCRS